MRRHDLDRRRAPLRFVRSARPPLAERGGRRRTFSAALEQAEQLWGASEDVDSVASPLLLFYGLAQAGRAICAAGVRHDHNWRPKAGHGLQFRASAPPEGDILDLRNATISPAGDGLIQRVAHVVGSPVLANSVSMAELIAAHALESFFATNEWNFPTPMDVFDRYRGPEDRMSVALGLSPLPGHLLREAAGSSLYKKFDAPEHSEIAQWLSAYPSLARLGDPTSFDPPNRIYPGGRFETEVYELAVRWKTDTDRLSEHEPISLDAPGDSNGSLGVALPAVGGNNAALHPLISWWLILFGFSMLARYYPDEWTTALDVDKSTLSVPIDHFLSAAKEQLPTYVFQILHGLQ